MNSKRLSLLLAASVMLTGAVSFGTGAFTSAQAITSVDELSDVNTSHWAYDALRDLVERYDVIEGYPDHTFRGDRTPTRWELAAALNAVMRAVGRDLARLQAEKANKTDLQTLARLQEEFRNELTALQARTSALEGRASAIEAKNEEQDNRLTLLEKTQLHGDFSVGILSDISSAGTRSPLSGAGTDDEDNNGIRDGITSIARVRLTLDIPVRDDVEDSNWGRGDVHMRLIGAMGRGAPLAEHEDNFSTFGVYNGYSRIANDRSNFNEGLRSGGLGTFNMNTRQTLYIENAHYKQHVKAGVPLLTDWFPGMDVLPDDGWETSGDLYLGVVPWRYLFDKSPYRGNELTQFQNTAFVNIPGTTANFNSPTVAYQWHQGLGSDDLNLDVTAAVASVDEGDFMSGMNLSYEARLNYLTGALVGDSFNMPGSVYAGGFHLYSNGNSSFADFVVPGVNRELLSSDFTRDDDDTTSGFYVGWNQEWYKGIGTTFNYLLQNAGVGNVLLTTLNGTANNAANQNALEGISVSVRQAISGVLHIPMAAVVPGWRDNDVLGIGYALTDLHENGMDDGPDQRNFIDDSWEKTLEAYYKWQATESISIVPSVQVIWNRMGISQNDTTWVLGARTNFTF